MDARLCAPMHICWMDEWAGASMRARVQVCIGACVGPHVCVRARARVCVGGMCVYVYV